MKREVFHISIPTPLNQIVLIPTVVLFAFWFVLHYSFWWVLLPFGLDAAFMALFVAGLWTYVQVHNARARRRYLKALETR